MNRPPKKKKSAGSPKDALAPEAEAAKAPISQDDRNIVNIDQAFQEADVEDKVWLFWQKNKGTLIGASVLAIVAVLAVEGYSFYKKQAEATLQANYQSASADNGLKAFGQEHPDTSLGAFATLQAADESFKAGDYTAAATQYSQVAKGLSGTPFANRAELGLAFSQIKSGDTDAGVTKLTQLTTQAGVMDTIRAEAAYNLAMLSLEAGDTAKASEWLDKINDLGSETMWSQQAQALINNTPELKNLAKQKAIATSEFKITPAAEAVPVDSSDSPVTDEAPSTDAEAAE